MCVCVWVCVCVCVCVCVGVCETVSVVCAEGVYRRREGTREGGGVFTLLIKPLMAATHTHIDTH